MEYINKQLKLILSKLEGLKTKLETVIETITVKPGQAFPSLTN